MSEARPEVAGLSSIGGRSENQDAWRTGTGPRHTVVLLADGAGGHKGGATASRIAVDTLLAHLVPEPQAALGPAVQAANDAIVATQQSRPEVSRMRTTVVALVIGEGQARWAHLGDSRLYLLRDHKVVVRTRDDSLPEVLLGQGQLKHEDELRHHPDRSRLLRALGREGEAKATVSAPIELAGGERFVLCSDGVWECFDRAELEAASARSTSPQELAAALAAYAADRGGSEGDNATVVVVDQPRAAVRREVESGASTGGAGGAVGWLLGLLAVVAVAVFLGGAGLVGFAIWQRKEAPAPEVVDTVGVRELHVGPGQDYPDAPAALAASVAGDVIVFHGSEGVVFTGPLRLAHSLSLQSHGGYDAVIHGSGGEPAVVVAAKGIELTDLNLWSEPGQPALVVAAGGGVDLQFLVLTSLTVEAGGTAKAREVQLHGGLRVAGILTVADLSVTDAPDVGVEVLEGATLEGRDLRVTGAGGWGLVAGKGTSVKLTELAVTASGEGGLQLSRGELFLDDSKISENRGPGVVLEEATAELHQVSITDNAGVGLDLRCVDLVEDAVELQGNSPEARRQPCEADTDVVIDEDKPGEAPTEGSSRDAPMDGQEAGKRPGRKKGKHKPKRNQPAKP